jgi:hypothetical protein
MDKGKSAVLLISVLLLIAGNFVSAASVTFIDSAYIGNGTLKISSPDNTEIIRLNSTESLEMHNGTAYMLDFKPSGFISLDKETNFVTFPSAEFLIAFFSNPINLIEILVVLLAILMIVVAL